MIENPFQSSDAVAFRKIAEFWTKHEKNSKLKPDFWKKRTAIRPYSRRFLLRRLIPQESQNIHPHKNCKIFKFSEKPAVVLQRLFRECGGFLTQRNAQENDSWKVSKQPNLVNFCNVLLTFNFTSSLFVLVIMVFYERAVSSPHAQVCWGFNFDSGISKIPDSRPRSAKCVGLNFWKRVFFI